MSQIQIAFRVPEDIAAELERGRVAQRYPSQVEYIIALIRAGGGRVSGLGDSRMFDSAATDARVGGAITNAISAIEQGDNAQAIDELRFAQTVILEALSAKHAPLSANTADRLRVRGGGDDWTGRG